MELKGIPVSKGIVIGKACMYIDEEPEVKNDIVLPHYIGTELEKLEKAFEQSKREIKEIKKKTLTNIGENEAKIFDAHLSMLNDPFFYEEMVRLIKEDNLNAAYAVKTVMNKFVSMYSKIPNSYLSERASDVKDIGTRIIRNIIGMKKPKHLNEIDEGVIIVANDLTPSDTVLLNKKRVLGFVTEEGSVTSHAAIMAKGLDIPAVVGVGGVTGIIKENSTVIVDGFKGLVISEPDYEKVSYYTTEVKKYNRYRNELRKFASFPANTIDGRSVELLGNISTPEDVNKVLSYGGDGVGLFRTEFLYIDRTSFPTEEEQFEAYKDAAERLKGKPLIIRTLDIGGDKKAPCFNIPDEGNPFLGWRGIRVCLEQRELFKIQLKAILRASVYGDISIMYPMIAGVDEIREANSILNEAKQELYNAKVKFNNNIKVGIMIEVPSAALTADIIAREVDFFSIGTNDLCQYCLAVDRMNQKVSSLYQPMHPAMLRIIKYVIGVSHKNGKSIGVCGEMAGDPLAAAILLGLGLDKFSMGASSILVIKKIINTISYKEAREFAKRVIKLSTTEEVLEQAEAFLRNLNVELY